MKNDADAQEQKRCTPRMLKITVVFDEFDDNNGRREMAYFLILSMAGTTARLLDHYDEGRPWRTTQSGLSQVP